MRPIDADKFKQDLLDKSFYPAIVARAIDNAPTVNPYEWISIEDRLPENDEPVLVYKARCNDAYANMETAYFDYGRWMGVVGENVTHWMPLPAPPTEKEN